MAEYTIRELPPDDRPREKLELNGPEYLSDSELLALVIRSGVEGKNALEVTREILRDLDFDNISNSTLQELQRYEGIGKVKAGQILAVFELGKRFAREEVTAGEQIFGLEDVLGHLNPEMRSLEREELRALHLNNANELIHEETIFYGSLNEVQIQPREVAKSCLKHNSGGIILAHNHPGGEADPSEADINVTEKVRSTLRNLGVNLIDHIIVGKYGEISLKREGYLKG
ncbi:MAG: DNA repair protein RadC [Candidatus Bipolaricaulota bacterium]|nr:DNA repair protein RadC [Candidatus Bipolaricaulota bacterium]MBS3791951.1 DNA repair protein RadC [Candidatus Bipolaricaulota bacterium]